MSKILWSFVLFWLCFSFSVSGQTYSSPDFPHPSFADSEISNEKLIELLEATERERKMSEDELVNLIEEKSMAFWVCCPNCEGGFQGGMLQWKPNDPHQVYCPYCGLTYPNEKYPDNKVQEIRDGLGNIQKFYYNDVDVRVLFQQKKSKQ